MTKDEFIQQAEEAGDDQIAEWSQIPDDALDGFCRDPECLNPHCQNPNIAICRYGKGIYVIAQYITHDERVEDKINGQPVPKCALGYLDMETLLADFGPGAAAAVHVHSYATQFVGMEGGPAPVAKDLTEGLPN